MIDKITLNNEIVAMRKVVRQAKVHVIGKLIREIKKLRASKGDDAVKAKCSRKAEKKVEILMVLKKLNPDVVSKFALKNTKNAAEKIADANTDIKERAVYRLISSKVLADRVNQFRSKYPDWQEFISETLDELGANRKKNVKKADKNIHQKIKPGRKEKCESFAKKFNGSKESPAGSLQKSRIEKSGKVAMKSKFNAGWIIKDVEPVQKVCSIQTVKDTVKKHTDKKEQSKLLSSHGQSKSNMSSYDVFKSQKKKDATEIRKFNELLNENEDSSVEKEHPHDELEVESGDKDSSKEGAVDPFFMTSDGTSVYRTNIKTADEDDEDGQMWKKKPFTSKWGDSERRSFSDQGLLGRVRGHPGRGGSQSGRGGGHFLRGAVQFGRGRGQFNRGRGSNKDKGNIFGSKGKTWNNNIKFKQNPGDSQLHPSWEAKRKQKEQSISNVVFQGKKIKFDDD